MRHNLCVNPSFEVSTAGWEMAAPWGSIERVPGVIPGWAHGQFLLELHEASQATSGVALVDRSPVSPGDRVGLAAGFSTDGPHSVRLSVAFYTADGSYIDGAQGAPVDPDGGAVATAVLVVPPNAASVQVGAAATRPAGTDPGVIRMDGVMLVTADTTAEAEEGIAVYRDGDSPGWEWDGAPGESASSQKIALDTQVFPGMDPVPSVAVTAEFDTGQLDGVAFMTVERISDGAEVVRGGWRRTAATVLTVLDTEVPFNTEVTYRVALLDAAGQLIRYTHPTDPVVVDFQGTVIHDPLQPTRAVLVEPQMGAALEQSRTRLGDLEQPHGVWVGRGRTGLQGLDLTAFTRTAEQESRMDAVLESDVLCYRTSLRQRLPQPLFFVAQEPIKEGLDWHTGGEWIRWHFQADQVRPPSVALVVSPLTWRDVMATYPTWDAAMAAYATWGDLMTDYSISGASDA